MQHIPHRALRCAATAALITAAAAAQAVPVQLTVTVENLAAANSVTFTPTAIGLHAGGFDAFDQGSVANPALATLAETGGTSAWLTALGAAQATAVGGSVGGLLLPGTSASASFTIDTMANGYLSFASMVLPSNDFFVGNDSPMAYSLFDGAGQLQLSSITVRAGDIWDAGSEQFDPAHAAFIGDAGARTPQGSVVARNFAELYAFNGLTTGAGYTFDAGLAGDTEVYRLSFAVAAVPEPQTYALMLAGLLMVGMLARRRRPIG